MNNSKDLFPSIKKSIEDLIEDEEGNIPGNKLLVLGAMVIVLGSILSYDAFAGHTSHSSHSSHTSGSGGFSDHGSHESHVSHASHTSGLDHSSHASHSNSSANSNTGNGTSNTPSAPAASEISGVAETAVANEDMFVLPDINNSVKLPNGSPVSGIAASLSLPNSSPKVKTNSDELHIPPHTDQVN